MHWRGWRHRMGLGQPDVEGKHARLNPEGGNQEQNCPDKRKGAGGADGSQAHLGTDSGQVQQDHGGTHEHPRGHAEMVIEVASLFGLWVFMVAHPHRGSYGHELKEEQQHDEVASQENTLGCP